MNMLLNTYLDIHMSMEPHHTIDMTANMLSIGRASHKRAVLAPVVVSAMFRTKLLGDATMQQINRLSPVLHPRSVGMLHHELHIVLLVHGRAAAIAIPHFTGGVVVLGGVETNTVMCIHSGV